MNQFEDMQTFVRIVETGSITKAAEQLDTVKSAVSRRLSDLEKRLGVSLLSRTTRTQVLTDSGKIYYEKCLRLIDDVAEVESQVSNEHAALKGRIKISAPLIFGIAHLSSALRKFNEIYQDIIFDIDFNDRKVDIIEDGFDLAIRISHLNDSSLIARKLTQVNMVLCASPKYLQEHGTPLTPKELLTGHVKLQYKSEADNWIFKSPKGKEIPIKVPSALNSNNGEFLCQAAIDGLGLIYTPDFICYEAIQRGELQPILTKYLHNVEIPVYVIYPQTRHLSQRIRSLVDYLAEYYGDDPYWQIT